MAKHEIQRTGTQQEPTSQVFHSCIMAMDQIDAEAQGPTSTGISYRIPILRGMHPHGWDDGRNDVMPPKTFYIWATWAYE